MRFNKIIILIALLTHIPQACKWPSTADIQSVPKSIKRPKNHSKVTSFWSSTRAWSFGSHPTPEINNKNEMIKNDKYEQILIGIKNCDNINFRTNYNSEFFIPLQPCETVSKFLDRAWDSACTVINTPAVTARTEPNLWILEGSSKNK